MRQGGQYGDPGGNPYEMQQRMFSQRIDHKPSNYQQTDEINSENEKFSSKGEGQWRWERDNSSHIYNQGISFFNKYMLLVSISDLFVVLIGQGADASRSYYQGQRSDQRLNASEKHHGSDLRSQATHEEDMEVGYEDNSGSHTFEAIEKRFYDDIFKLTKEHDDAEDAENARHRERVNAISAQYEEQLAALRARHISRRDEILRRESNARQQQYASSDMGMGMGMGMGMSHHQDHHHHHGYNVDSYRDRPRFTRDSRESGGRVYGSGSRYY